MIEQKQYSFQFKMLLIYTLLAILPLTFFFILLLQQWRTHELNNYTRLMTQYNIQVAEGFASVMDNTGRLTELYRTDSKLLSIITENSDYNMDYYYRDLIYIKNQIRNTRITSPYLEAVNYLSANDLSYGSTDQSPQFMQLLEAFAMRTDMIGQTSYISPIYNTIINHRDVKAITMVETLKNPYSQKDAGSVFLTLDFRRAMRTLMNGSNPTSTFFVAQHGQVVFVSGEQEEPLTEAIHDYILRKYQADYNYLTQMVVSVPGHGRYLVVRHHDAAYNYHVFQYVPMSLLDRNFIGSMLFYISMVLIVVCGVLLVGVSFFLRTGKTIRQLLFGMSQVEGGRFVQVPEERSDELGSIVNGFNSMSARLDETMQTVRVYAEKQQEYQLLLLQAQINPHFIYNTLNLISSISYLESDGPVVQISNSLARMLYYNLKAGQRVTLREELEQYKRYVAIQKMRFVDKICDRYAVDKTLLDCLVPKFILQPLLENAVNHGLIQKSGVGTISLEIRSFEQGILICVKDDGIGMEDKILQDIRGHLSQNEEEYLLRENIKHVGILNVHHRIRKQYGGDCGLWLESAVGVGTTVTIRLLLERGSLEAEG